MSKKPLKTHYGSRGKILCDTEHAQHFTFWPSEVTCNRCLHIAFETAHAYQHAPKGMVTGRLSSSEPEMQNIRPPLNEEQQAKRATLWEALKERMRNSRLVVVDPLHDYLKSDPKDLETWASNWYGPAKLSSPSPDEDRTKEKIVRLSTGYSSGAGSFREALRRATEDPLRPIALDELLPAQYRTDRKISVRTIPDEKSYIEMPSWWKPMHGPIYTDPIEALAEARKGGKIVMGYDPGRGDAMAYVLIDPRIDTRASWPPWLPAQD